MADGRVRGHEAEGLDRRHQGTTMLFLGPRRSASVGVTATVGKHRVVVREGDPDPTVHGSQPVHLRAAQWVEHEPPHGADVSWRGLLDLAEACVGEYGQGGAPVVGVRPQQTCLALLA
jgi:hypothetical protein